MPSRTPDVIRISSPSDVVCAVTQMLGFVPADSVVVVCTHDRRCRIGLVLRYDLAAAWDIERFVDVLDARIRHEGADGIFAIVFTDLLPAAGELPYRELLDALAGGLRELVLDVLLVCDGRWWSVLCDDPQCCGPAGTPIDLASRGATAIAAAYALIGQGVLPDREALVRSLRYDGRDPAAMVERLEAARDRHSRQRRKTRQRAVRALVNRLTAELADPRGSVSDDDAAELAALCEDVIVRDEVLVYALTAERRDLLLRVLHSAVGRIPPPEDVAICATLAWVSYAAGDGAVANIALDRTLATDPTYSLALLIMDALDRQVPPDVLQDVMREAARDLRRRHSVG
jgi:hypothetical protein